MNTFKNAVIVGRFQPIHIGHEKLINLGLSSADRLIVFVSSSDKEKTERNPYSAEYRIKLIEKIYSDKIKEGRLIVKPLKDLTNENDLTFKWGEYVIKEAENILKDNLECIIYGKDKNIFKCFSKDTVKNISEIFVSRNQLEVSATKIRQFLEDDDKISFNSYINPKIHDEYECLRSILLKVKDENKE